MSAFKEWTEKHATLWQFILFNVLSNISTISRFVFTWLGTALFVNALGMVSPFKFLIFDYTSAGSKGLGGFLTFLIAEVVAQVVNFFVQKTWVFKSDTAFSTAAPRFAVLAVIIVVVNLVLPGHITNLCTSWGLSAGLAATLASVVNTLLAVVVSYPLLKFWVMPDGEKNKAASASESSAADAPLR